MTGSLMDNVRIDSEFLAKIEDMAASRNCSVNELVHEALREFIDKNSEADKLRESVMRTYQDSHKKYASLYQRLAQ